MLKPERRQEGGAGLVDEVMGASSAGAPPAWQGSKADGGHHGVKLNLPLWAVLGPVPAQLCIMNTVSDVM